MRNRLRVLVDDRDGVLHAFDVDDNRLWTTRLDGPISAAPSAHIAAPADPGAQALLQLDPGDRIYVGTERGTLYSLNPGDGSVVFAAPLDGPIVASPQVLRGFDPQPDAPKLIVATTAGTLYGLFADDATEIWRIVTGAPLLATPAIGTPNIIEDPRLADPWLFVTMGDGSSRAFEAPDERPPPVWETRLQARSGARPHSPTASCTWAPTTRGSMRSMHRAATICSPATRSPRRRRHRSSPTAPSSSARATASSSHFRAVGGVTTGKRWDADESELR